MANKILVNDRCLLRPGAGVSGYLRCLMRYWPRESAVELVGFCGRWLRGSGLKSPPVDKEAPARLPLCPLDRVGRTKGLSRRVPHRVRRVAQKLYGQALAAEFRRGSYVASFEPNHLAQPLPGPTLTTVHDLSVLEHPQWHPDDRVAWWKADLRRSIAATDRWIADSRFTRDRMVELLGIDRGTIEVVPLAARPLPYPAGEDMVRLKRRAGLPERYLLHLGTLEPRKNITVLLDAYAALDESVRRSCRLILAGGIGWGRAEFWRRLMNHPIAGEVLWSGRVGDANAAILLAGARAVFVPSHYEGFGLPVLEAMACGTPVVCSAAGALRETAGGAAETIDAGDVEGWANAMRTAAEDDSWCDRLGKAGRLRAGQFSWARTARRHAELLLALASG